jgi:hypothetical protein
VSNIYGAVHSVLRQLTYSRAIPHLKVKGRIIFDQNAIKETVAESKEFGWSDPEDKWTVAKGFWCKKSNSYISCLE